MAIDYDSKNAKCLNSTCTYNLWGGEGGLERCQNSQGIIFTVQFKIGADKLCQCYIFHYTN